MVDANVVSIKLGELADRIGRVRSHCPASPQDLAADRDALDLVSFNLLLAVQTCLDLASHLIADERWAPAATARDAFQRLEMQGVISRETTEPLLQAVGLRNVVAHGYSGIVPAQVHAAATRGLADLERFAAEVGAWAEGSTRTAG